MHMKQTSLGLGNSTKRTRKREFLAQMERVVPWAALVELVAPFAPEGRRGRPPFSVDTMLRIHFMQQWFTLSDPAMEEALHDVPLFREFAGLGGWSDRLPDESTILRFRHLLEKHKLAEQILAIVNDMLVGKGLLLKAGTVVDATLIAAPSSTKNASGERDPEMHQSKKGNQWYFGAYFSDRGRPFQSDRGRRNCLVEDPPGRRASTGFECSSIVHDQPETPSQLGDDGAGFALN